MKQEKRALLADVLLLCGAVAVSVGAGLIFVPAGLIVGGVCASGLSLLVGLGVGTHAS